MNDAFGVRGVQSIGNLHRQCEQNIRLDGLSVDTVLQRHAIQKFHGDEAFAVLFADFVDGADVVVVERGSSTGLPAKTLQGLCVLRQIVRQKLQRHEAP